MKFYALIVGGQVAEVIPEYVNVDGVQVHISDRFHPDFVAQLVEHDPNATPVDPEPETPAVPQMVSKRQAWLALYDEGLLTAVQAALDAAGPRARGEWENTNVVDRNWPLVVQMATAIDLDLDDLFRKAVLL